MSQHALTEDFRLSRPWQIITSKYDIITIATSAKKRRSDPSGLFAANCPRYGRLRHKHTQHVPRTRTHSHDCVYCIRFILSRVQPLAKGSMRKIVELWLSTRPDRNGEPTLVERTTIELNVCVLFVGGKYRHATHRFTITIKSKPMR